MCGVDGAIPSSRYKVRVRFARLASAALLAPLGRPLTAAFARRAPSPAPASGLPAYVERPCETVRRHPIEALRTTLFAFGIPARIEALAAMVDAHLNAPSGGAVQYRPAAPLVILGCARLGEARMVEEDRDRGYMSEIDVAFWVPLVATRRVAGAFVPDRLVWLQPWIFVDSTEAVVHGREIFGFPKAHARFALDDDEHGLSSLSLDTLVHPTPGAREPNVERRLVTITREQLGEKERDLAALEARVSPFRALAGWGGDLRTRLVALQDVRIAFLKQFRHIADASRACYQAVCEAPASVTRFERMRAMRGDYRVRLASYASHPIAAELGLEHGEGEGSGALDLAPDFAVQIDFDFVMGRGVEIWRGS
jgi:hypothetical protein